MRLLVAPARSRVAKFVGNKRDLRQGTEVPMSLARHCYRCQGISNTTQRLRQLFGEIYSDLLILGVTATFSMFREFPNERAACPSACSLYEKGILIPVMTNRVT
jgi:hypothetical protein